MNNETAGGTNYERFARAPGVLFVTEYYGLPAPTIEPGVVEIVLVRSTNTLTNTLSVALRISFMNDGRCYAIAFLDEDEIKSLELALKYIIKEQAGLTESLKTYTGIEYRSRGGFEMGFFANPKWKALGRAFNSEQFMGVGGTKVFLPDFREFANSVDEALFKLETFAPERESSDGEGNNAIEGSRVNH
jgi:hypothetical protein